MMLRVLLALFAAYVAATALHVGYVTHHEPFAFDAWNVAVNSGAKPITIDRFFDFWWWEYTHSNPRIGQPLAYLTYKLEWFAEIATPLVYLGLTLAVTVLGLGRWPRRARDFAFWAIAIGFSWFALPEIGRNMFCRAYGTNYIYTAAIQLWFLVPLRLSPAGDAPVGKCVAYGMFGVVAGMCNEHTGPTLIACLFGYAYLRRRQGWRPRLALAGFLGLAVGFAAIFFAPGQEERYGGIGEEVGLLTRLVQRGIVGNVDILRDYVIYAAPLLGVIVLVLIGAGARDSSDDLRRRRPLRLIAAAIGAGFVMAATLFVSPKLGSRFYIFSMALLLAGVIALLDTVAVRPKRLAPFVAIAVIASAYAVMRTVPLYMKVAKQGAERMEALEASKPGAIFVADGWAQVDESWWYIGDDFRDFQKRELVAKYFGLSRVFFRGYGLKAPLGLQGIKLAPKYRVVGESCEREYDAFDLGVTRGFDIAGVIGSARSAIELLRSQLVGELETFELRVEFLGAPPALPRSKVLVARWRDGKLEGYAGRIVRKTSSVTRDIEFPKTLAGRPFEVFMVNIGGEIHKLGTTDGKPLQYVPWHSGVYWVLACDANECWVMAATRSG
jgi:hypothetical protein